MASGDELQAPNLLPLLHSFPAESRSGRFRRLFREKETTMKFLIHFHLLSWVVLSGGNLLRRISLHREYQTHRRESGNFALFATPPPTLHHTPLLRALALRPKQLMLWATNLGSVVL